MSNVSTLCGHDTAPPRDTVSKLHLTGSTRHRTLPSERFIEPQVANLMTDNIECFLGVPNQSLFAILDAATRGSLVAAWRG